MMISAKDTEFSVQSNLLCKLRLHITILTLCHHNQFVGQGRINFCHRWLKKLQTQIAALAMITQHRQTYASHMDFDSFTVFMRLFRSLTF